MKIIIPLITLILFSNCTNQNSENISSNWQWNKNDSIKDFSINLKQINEKLEGSYCGVFDSGNRIDCPLSNENNIKGTYINGKWEIEYFSNYSNKNGKAIIVYNKEEKNITWKDLTTDNGSFCPENATLTK